MSPLFGLCTTPTSQVILADLLRDCPRLKEGLTANHLATPVIQGPDAGKSSLYWLCSSPKGQAILVGLLRDCPQLRRDLSISDFTNTMAEEPSGIRTWLCNLLESQTILPGISRDNEKTLDKNTALNLSLFSPPPQTNENDKPPASPRKQSI